MNTKKKVPMYIGVGIAVVIALMVLVAILGGSKKIDLSDYLIWEFQGYNGYGYYVCEVDSDKLGADYDGKIESEEHQTAPSYTFAKRLSQALETNSTGYLSNGDTVEVTVNPESVLFENYNIKLKDYKIAAKVEGLEEPKEIIDPLKDVEIVFYENYFTGQLYSVINGYDQEIYPALRCYTDIEYGEEVTFEMNEDAVLKLAANGTCFENTSITVKVEDYYQHVNEKKDITEAAISKLVDDGLAAYDAFVSSVPDYSQKANVQSVKPKYLCFEYETGETDANSVVVIYYEAQISYNDPEREISETITAYLPKIFKNVRVSHSTGDVFYDESEYVCGESMFTSESGETFKLYALDGLYFSDETIDIMKLQD